MESCLICSHTTWYLAITSLDVDLNTNNPALDIKNTNRSNETSFFIQYNDNTMSACFLVNTPTENDMQHNGNDKKTIMKPYNVQLYTETEPSKKKQEECSAVL